MTQWQEGRATPGIAGFELMTRPLRAEQVSSERDASRNVEKCSVNVMRHVTWTNVQ